MGGTLWLQIPHAEHLCLLSTSRLLPRFAPLPPRFAAGNSSEQASLSTTCVIGKQGLLLHCVCGDGPLLS